MALADLQTFIQEALSSYDETIDLTPGSPADVQVVQRILRRLGSDPFTVDMGVFLQDRLNQEFPEIPTKEGDAITDLLIKPAMVLWDPVVRENFRVRAQLSFRNPELLTLDEAEALGANLFSERDKGDTARGRARVYFSRPQNAAITPANFITSKAGLHFFPTQTQSISAAEMLFNLEGELYYFDVDVVAENAGDEYNIGPDELVTIANISPAVRVTNKTRFRFGEPAENAVDFVARVEQDLTERSLVTERGIAAKIGKSFTEVTRLAVTGYRDPEMNRDVLRGGGLGKILLAGVAMVTVADGEGAATTRRVQFNSISEGTTIDLTAVIGPPGQTASGFTLTVVDAFPTTAYPRVRDIAVLKVVNSTTLDLVDQVLQTGVTGKAWMLRKNELTLSGIPGGILFPDSEDGTIAVPDNEVHIGGTTDIFVRGTDLDTSALLLASIVDDSPLLQGISAGSTSGDIVLGDYVLGTNYSTGDDTHTKLTNAVGLTIQILDAPAAGSYRILGVTHTPAASPVLDVTPAISGGPFSNNMRWRLLDEIDIDLVEPKETKISGSDLETVQGLDTVETASGTDFQSYGVGQGDILRITTGNLIIGDYTVQQVLAPLFQKVKVDRVLPATVAGAKYTIFRSNEDGGMKMPFVRITSIDLLDTSNQPVGTKVPYAKPVDIQTRSFANASHGIKAEGNDYVLGLVTQRLTDSAFDFNGLTLTLQWEDAAGATITFTVTFTAGATTVATCVSQINAQIATFTSNAITLLALSMQDDAPFKRIGFIPVGKNVRVTAGTVVTSLWATSGVGSSSRMVRAASVPNWNLIRPAIDSNFDVIQVLDGLQIGFYDQVTTDTVNGVYLKNAKRDFQPEIKRRVQVGSRSYGSARLFFLEPTSIEFGAAASLDVESADGALLTFIPDPTLNYQRIPALPSETKPKDGVTNGTAVFTSASMDFIKRGIQVGDLLEIDYIPLTGSIALADPVATLEFKILTVSIDGGVDKDIIFVKDDTTIPAGSVTRAGVANQINKIVGQNICKINGSNQLEFEADASITVRGTGTANAILGFPGTDSDNASANKGEYSITVVGQTTLTIGTTLSSESRVQFKVFRVGLQRICSTSMAKQVAETGLFYFDLELVSLGTGDHYNIEAGRQMTATGYKADGYYLTTDDANLTFSPAEKPKLRISPTILEVGTTDNPDNATSLSAQNLQINYDRSAITNSVQNFVLSETERVICQSPLARHLVPHFVRFDIIYTGGSQESEVRPDIERLIKGLLPSDFLEVSDLEKILSVRGAKSVSNPITLLAVVHNFDRTITMQRSQDRINAGRLAAFIPDVLTITRKIG